MNDFDFGLVLQGLILILSTISLIVAYGRYTMAEKAIHSFLEMILKKFQESHTHISKRSLIVIVSCVVLIAFCYYFLINTGVTRLFHYHSPFSGDSYIYFIAGGLFTALAVVFVLLNLVVLISSILFFSIYLIYNVIVVSAYISKRSMILFLALIISILSWLDFTIKESYGFLLLVVITALITIISLEIFGKKYGVLHSSANFSFQENLGVVKRGGGLYWFLAHVVS